MTVRLRSQHRRAHRRQRTWLRWGCGGMPRPVGHGTGPVADESRSACWRSRSAPGPRRRAAAPSIPRSSSVRPCSPAAPIVPAQRTARARTALDVAAQASQARELRPQEQLLPMSERPRDARPTALQCRPSLWIAPASRASPHVGALVRHSLAMPRGAISGRPKGVTAARQCRAAVQRPIERAGESSDETTTPGTPAAR